MEVWTIVGYNVRRRTVETDPTSPGGVRATSTEFPGMPFEYFPKGTWFSSKEDAESFALEKMQLAQSSMLEAALKLDVVSKLEAELCRIRGKLAITERPDV